jgi:hypothetical protein
MDFSRITFANPQEDELRRRMALAKSQGWSDEEIQRSAMMERLTAQAPTAAPPRPAAQEQSGGLAEALLNFVPFGNIARKAVTGQADQITPGEVGMEVLLTALPFGLGKAGKLMSGAAKTAKAAGKTSAKVTAGAAKTSTATGKTVDRASTVQNTGDLADAALDVPFAESATPDSFLAKTADKLTRTSSIAPTSTIESASRQKELIDLIQRTPELKGSSARKFQNVESVIGNKAGQVDELLRDVPNTIPGRQLGEFFDQLSNGMDKLDQTNFRRMWARLKGQTFGKNRLPNQVSPTEINGMLRGVNSQLSSVMRKIQMGTTLTSQDNAMLFLREHLQDALYGVTPKQLQPIVKQLNKDQSLLIEAIPEFKKASEQRVNIMGMTLPGSKAPYQAVQAVTDAAGRGANKLAGNTPGAMLAREGAKQAGVRLGADLLGVRGTPQPEPALDVQDPNSMMTQPSTMGPNSLMLGDQGVSQLQEKLKEDFLMTGGQNTDMLKQIYGGTSQKMSAAQQKQLMGTSTANSIVDQIEAELDGLAQQGNVGRVGGLIGQAQGAIGLNDAVRAYEDTRSSKALMIIKAIMGSAGSVSDTDRVAIEGAIPSGMETAGERARKIASLRSIIAAYEGGATAGGQASDDLLSQLNGL